MGHEKIACVPKFYSLIKKLNNQATKLVRLSEIINNGLIMQGVTNIEKYSYFTSALESTKKLFGSSGHIFINLFSFTFILTSILC